MIYSAMIRGILQKNKEKIQLIRKAPAPWLPPFWAAIRGNLQMFPVPIAIPKTLTKNPHLEEK
tara:strand:- start:481 stop:669 length:189 start_codon:yes stop_codon:yes gene_type:complete